MTGDKSCTRPRRLQVKTVRGDPYQVHGRKLTPVARVLSYGQVRGMIGTDRVGGWGTAFASISPLAIVEERDGVEHPIPITDGSVAALRGMVVGSVAIILLCTAIRWWVRCRRAGRESA